MCTAFKPNILISLHFVRFIFKYALYSWGFCDFQQALITLAIIAGVSMTSSVEVDDPKGIQLTSKLFITDSVFNISAYAILIMLVVLYTIFW
jgi:SSS family solute:Na+ symporter